MALLQKRPFRKKSHGSETALGSQAAPAPSGLTHEPGVVAVLPTHARLPIQRCESSHAAPSGTWSAHNPELEHANELQSAGCVQAVPTGTRVVHTPQRELRGLLQ